MNLRAAAEQDLQFILEDDVRGGAFPITLIDTSGTVYDTLKGLSNDISQVIDTDTGEIVSGRLATVSLRIKSLYDAGITELPKYVAEQNSKPWLVQFDDINGLTYLFKVAKSNPDRGLGILTLILEFYSNEPYVANNAALWVSGNVIEWVAGNTMEWTA